MPEDDLLHELRTRRGLAAAPPDDRIALARLLREASLTSARDWVMSEQDERDAAHVAGLVRLLRAARGSLFAYADWPPFSWARSRVLLRGAAALGIETSWTGWA
jgi:hypothetical protein